MSTVSLIIALGAGIAADLPSLLPLSLLLGVAGLALVGVLAQALGEMVRGPLLLGPLFAFAAGSSQLTLLGLAPPLLGAGRRHGYLARLGARHGAGRADDGRGQDE